jgi:hypothetical protein
MINALDPMMGSIKKKTEDLEEDWVKEPGLIAVREMHSSSPPLLFSPAYSLKYSAPVTAFGNLPLNSRQKFKCMNNNL